MLAAYLFNNLFQALSGLADGVASPSVRSNSCAKISLIHLQTLPHALFRSQPAGELMSRLTNDIDAINQAVSHNVVALLASVLSLAGILIAMFALDVWLALASVLVVPIMFWFTQFVAKYTRRGFRDLQKQMGELNGVMEEAISGQKVVKAFRRNESVIETFREHNEKVYKAGVYANSYALLLMPLTSVLGNFFVIVLAGLGGWLALRGLVSVGIIATFIIYGQNFIQPLRQLANMYNAIQARLAGAERVFEIIDTPSEPDDAPQAIALNKLRGEVHFDHVQFAYEPGTPIIKEMTLEAKVGEPLPWSAQPAPARRRSSTCSPAFMRSTAARSVSTASIFATSRKPICAANWAWCCKTPFSLPTRAGKYPLWRRLDATDEECIHAAELADADHFIRQLPQGYQTQLSERASNLSQGQRQLLAIARAILANPRILILDEATSSVDTRTEARIQKALLRLMEGRTSFVIAHRLSTIRPPHPPPAHPYIYRRVTGKCGPPYPYHFHPPFPPLL